MSITQVSKQVSLWGLVLAAVLLAACAPEPAASATGAALRPVPVAALEVRVGVGSPIPVELIVDGTWPDLCAQLAEVKQSVADGRITVELLASPLDPACPPDYLGLPFRLAIPINAVELAAGRYDVVVNGFSTTVEIDPVKALGEMPVVGGARVDHVAVEIGQGSPIPVNAVVSANFPDTCAQLGAIEQRLVGNVFEITMTTLSPAGAVCAPDGLPFRTTIPLNVVGLEPGQYTVTVNGVSAGFTW
jgi:hypothetical protein